MKQKKPGRVKLVCVVQTCKKPFSTHSSNRVHCHTCVPKCKERHVFNVGKRAPKKITPPNTIDLPQVQG